MRRSGRRQRRNRSSATSAGRSGLRLRAFAEVLFDEDLHAKRVASLANGVAGVLNAAMLTIHAISRAYAAVASIDARSGVKQIDMLLSNVGVVLEVLFPSWLCAYASRGTADHDPSSRTCAREFGRQRICQTPSNTSTHLPRCSNASSRATISFNSALETKLQQRLRSSPRSETSRATNVRSISIDAAGKWGTSTSIDRMRNARCCSSDKGAPSSASARSRSAARAACTCRTSFVTRASRTTARFRSTSRGVRKR